MNTNVANSCEAGALRHVVRRLLALCVLSCGSLALSGCGPTSEFPLIDADHAEQDPRLYGSWVADDDESSLEHEFLHIGQDHMHEANPDENPGRMQAWRIVTGKKRMSNGDRKTEKTWDMFEAGPPIGMTFTSSRVGETQIASVTTNIDLPELMKDELKNDKDWKEIWDRYWFVKYEVSDDKLSLWLMDDSFVGRAVQEGKLPGTATHFFTWKIRLSASQEELRQFVEQNVDRGLFVDKHAMTFQRVRGSGHRETRE